MGVSAYNRGSQSIARGIRNDYPDHQAFRIMDRINSLPKKEQRTPFAEKLKVSYSKGVWWLEDAHSPEKMGRWYTSLKDAIVSWDIYLTGYDYTTNTWTAEPI